MAPVEGNMDMLSQAVLKEAQAESEKVLAGAREKADAIWKRARDRAEAERRGILENANTERERIRQQAIASAQIQARTVQLEHREKLLRRVFDAAHQQLPSIQQWSDYEKIACTLLREAASNLHSEAVKVRADKTTLQYLTKPVLEEMAKELNVKLLVGEPLLEGIGVIAETEDGRRRYDNTLQTRLDRMQDSLRSPVYHVLIGESL